ncbi:sulfite oxidase-like oxidoreductase [Pseudalkalibacillus salsuginis]|uniref:sulfite oxidase-like oxidoreductase n=1 Tax=Pseudalkalibacillus salsuginis TaxID=2910972 RepID=UPI001F20323F|nr:sulfite oxidase-like oxidoreductase [Pseudalkalibacillus salsuginis]MCF6409040.1 sulfite oxidase-like oxidoreductase [Pseudalkalibacillus salsuginis]
MYFGKEESKKDERVPPNQVVTKKWPVLHYGNVPYYQDLGEWDLRLFGHVEEEIRLTYEEVMEIPIVRLQNDIHCVTGWSRLDNQWEGISTKEIFKKVKLLPEVNYVLIHAEEDWTTNLPIEDFFKESSLLAHTHDGKPLTPEHGFPLRAVIPHLYFWKSAKWIRGIEFIVENKPGFWEKNGYHMHGRPWKEERFSWD